MQAASFVFPAFPTALRSALLRSIACAAVLCAASSPSAHGASLVVRYPSAGAELTASTCFVFGAAQPGSAVTVNGREAAIAPDGGWIAYVSVAAGDFTLRVRATVHGETESVDRAIHVTVPEVAAFPSRTTILQPQDSVTLAIGAPGARNVTAYWPGTGRVALERNSDSVESDTFSVQAVLRRPGIAAPVLYRIVRGDGSIETVRSRAPLQTASARTLFIGEVRPYAPDALSGARPYGMLAPAPYADTAFTVPIGTPFAVTGRQGDALRVATGADGNSAWIDRREIVRIPRGIASVATSPAISVRHERRWDIYTIALPGRIPFRVDEDVAGGARLFVTVFNGSGMDRRLAIETHDPVLWGYRARWIGNDLEIALRRPPTLSRGPAPAISGLSIVLDPGHSPDTGAIGPMGTLERDVNLDIALRLAALLRSKGARITMTRESDVPVRLYDRPALAERIDADVLVSIHNNAPPDGADPAQFRGYSVYYFYPHSVALANALHAAYARDTDLHDDGLHRGDLALVRTSQMPAVLTESAYITWPWEEMKLREPAYRERLAATLADGLERWAELVRRRESGPSPLP